MKNKPADIDPKVWDLSIAFGCTDYDRCDGRIWPKGSCTDCLENAARVIEELAQKGYALARTP
jgi:hypothetical protein